MVQRQAISVATASHSGIKRGRLFYFSDRRAAHQLVPNVADDPRDLMEPADRAEWLPQSVPRHIVVPASNSRCVSMTEGRETELHWNVSGVSQTTHRIAANQAVGRAAGGRASLQQHRQPEILGEELYLGDRIDSLGAGGPEHLLEGPAAIVGSIRHWRPGRQR